MKQETIYFSTHLLNKPAPKVGPQPDTIIKRNQKKQELIHAIKDHYRPTIKTDNQEEDKLIQKSILQEAHKKKQVKTGEDATE